MSIPSGMVTFPDTTTFLRAQSPDPQEGAAVHAVHAPQSRDRSAQRCQVDDHGLRRGSCAEQACQFRRTQQFRDTSPPLPGREDIVGMRGSSRRRSVASVRFAWWRARERGGHLFMIHCFRSVSTQTRSNLVACQRLWLTQYTDKPAQLTFEVPDSLYHTLPYQWGIHMPLQRLYSPFKPCPQESIVPTLPIRIPLTAALLYHGRPAEGLPAQQSPLRSCPPAAAPRPAPSDGAPRAPSGTRPSPRAGSRKP